SQIDRGDEPLFDCAVVRRAALQAQLSLQPHDFRREKSLATCPFDRLERSTTLVRLTRFQGERGEHAEAEHATPYRAADAHQLAMHLRQRLRVEAVARDDVWHHD